MAFGGPAQIVDVTGNPLGTSGNPLIVGKNPRGIATVLVTPGVTAAGAYAAQDVLGNVMTFAGATIASGATVEVANVILHWLSAITAVTDLYLLSRLPTGTYTDNLPFTLANADMPYVIDVVHFNGDNSASGGSAGTGYQNSMRASNTGQAANNRDSTVTTNLYGLMVLRQSIPGILTGVGDLTVVLQTIQAST